jgi:FAD/FMN-containing dehydrogenase/Fe-S oxidoreductase
VNAPETKPLTFQPKGAAGDLARRLAGVVAGDVLFDRASRGRYSTDASIYQIEPVGVLVPRSDADVHAAFAVCRELGIPLLPRGAGSSQCGQTVGAALVVDHSKYLNQIVAFDRDAMTVTVEPGIVLDALNAWLKPYGLWFPVDVSTSAQCTLGGMTGNNSCGSRSIAYGNMVHNVLAVDAMLADGTAVRFGPEAEMDMAVPRVRDLVQTLQSLGAREREEIERQVPKVMRRVGGYNIDLCCPQSERPYTADGSVNYAHLLVGSEGTLAWTRSVMLRLAPPPPHRVLGVVNFPTLYRAMDSARHIVGLVPSAVELVDRTMIDLARGNPAFRPVIDRALIGEPEAILLVEFIGETGDAAVRTLRSLVALMGDLGLPGSVVEMTDAAAQKALWEVRKAGLNIMMSMKGDGKPVSFIEDCAVPLEHLADYVDRLSGVFRKHGTRGTWYAHASVGTLHVRPILDMRRDGAVKMRAIAEEASAMVREYKGAYSGEHGDGLVRSEWVSWQFGPRLTRAFEEIKDLFDPTGLMNPGKIVRGTRMDDRSLFRFGPAHQPMPLTTALDWSAWDVQNDPVADTSSAPGTGGDPAHGFAKAVEMCNNNGHCRKFDAGTMCPSYRATRDEQHLTRGRANTLRLALSGQLGPDALASTAVHDAFDLCVSCKGCRRECPTGVDMARMKIEFLHHWQRAHGLSLKDRVVAHLPRWAPWAARVPWLFNARNAIHGLAALGERTLGLSAKRSLPVWRRDTFMNGEAACTGGCPSDADVVLFVDTFTNYIEPENAHAALAVLRAAGRRVTVARAAAEDNEPLRPLCCGRTYLAAGLVDEAKREAQRVVAALAPHVARGAIIVGLEPSCLLSLRDEFLVLGLGDAARRLSERAFLIEEFLAREHSAGRLALPLAALPEKRALLHGHCHQKAFDAMGATREVLAMVPGLAVDVVESSCCGMAGSFGYEAAHYDISMRMAELSLLPAVRAADPATLIVADGTSCRHQILDGTRESGHREPVHVVRVLARAIEASRATPRP